MPDVVWSQPQVASTPSSYTLAGAFDFELLSAQANFDGSGAGSSYLPTLLLLDPGGHIIASCPGPSVAAGGSAEVSWFPGLSQTEAPQPIGPQFSGNTIVPTSVAVGVRSVQPGPANFGAGVEHDGFRVIIPKTGVLHDLSVFVSAAAGSIEVAILDTNTPTRTILYKTGYVAVPGSHQWFTVGDPAFPVTVGDQIDISVALSSASCTVFWIGGLVNSGSTDAASGHLPTGFIPCPGGAPPKLAWKDTTSPVPYGVTATVAEANILDEVGVPLVIGRIV